VILKEIKTNHEHARIDPKCLFSEKAWWRWKVWQKKFKEAEKSPQGSTKPTEVKPHPTDVIRELLATKDFLTDIFKKEPTKADILQAIELRSIQRWLATGMISPYFVALCPLTATGAWGIDMDVYINRVDDKVRDWFQQNFKL
jgi:hypothetical protein